jgi:hypothetical protein
MDSPADDIRVRRGDMLAMNCFIEGMLLFKNRMSMLKIFGIPASVLLNELRCIELRATAITELVWNRNDGFWISKVQGDDFEAQTVRNVVSEILDLQQIMSQEFPGTHSRLFSSP